MSTKSKKFVLLVTVLLTIASMIAACGAPTQAPTQPPATEAPATEAPTEAPATEAPATEAPAAEGAPFTIGISNPFISSEYRTQMIEELIATNQEYMDQGLTTELVIESADTDVAGQIQQLQNLIAQDVDAILVNPGDVSGLNATLQEALDAGIIVISVDQELNVPGVYNVGIDQKEWAKTVKELLNKHREILDEQYRLSLESLDEAFRVAQSSDPQEYAKRCETLCKKSLEVMREAGELQVKETQEALNKWIGLAVKAAG